TRAIRDLHSFPTRRSSDLPATPIFLWRETGPIEYYLQHGYAFVHLDVRGTGRSEGDYRYMCAAEQRDLYDVIVWITQQSWSNGRSEEHTSELKSRENLVCR